MIEPRTLQTDVQTPAWAGILPVSYTLSEAEAAAAREVRTAAAPAGWVPIMWLVLGVVNMGLGVGRSHLNPYNEPGFSNFYVAIGIVYIALAATQRFKWRPLYGNRQRNFSLRFTEQGIEVATPAAKLLPWRSIAFVSDSGETFTFQSATRPALLVPKRVFDDHGAAFWSALEAQLIGPYNLRRRTDSRTIYNTRELR